MLLGISPRQALGYQPPRLFAVTFAVTVAVTSPTSEVLAVAATVGVGKTPPVVTKTKNNLACSWV